MASSLLYGKGVFTTVAVIDGAPFLLDKHLLRLRRNALAIGIDVSQFDDEAVSSALHRTLEQDRRGHGRARITLYDERPSSIWGNATTPKIRLVVITGATRQMPAGLELTVSSFPVNSASPLAGIKSCNYLEPLMVFENARQGGWDEAVRCNERGHVASACMANVFWLSRGRLFTPALETGCLPGTTREFVMDDLECEEVCEGLEALERSDAIFLTSAGLGIKQVMRLGSRVWGASGHEILKLWPAKTQKHEAP